MKCKYCGEENPDGNLFCFHCGAKQGVEMNQSNDLSSNSAQSTDVQNNTTQNNTTQNNATQSDTTQSKSGGGLGIASMILGIVGIVFMCTPWLGFICSVLAIIFACVEKKHNGFRTAGLVLGIISISLWLVVFLFGLLGIMASVPFMT